jgi:hypothetical protein
MHCRNQAKFLSMQLHNLKGHNLDNSGEYKKIFIKNLHYPGATSALFANLMFPLSTLQWKVKPDQEIHQASVHIDDHNIHG